MVVAHRRPDGAFNTRPDPDMPPRRGRRPDRRRDARRDPGARGAVPPARARCLAAGRAAAAASSRSRPPRARSAPTGELDVALERPSDPGHGDFATTVALRLAPALRRAPREIAQELAGRAELGDSSRRSRSPAPASSTCASAPAWYRGGARRDRSRRATATAPARRRDPERIQVELVSANPTGPADVASAPQRRLRRLRRAAARVRRPRGRAGVLLNDDGTQIELFRASVEALRRGEEPPEGGYHGDVRGRDRAGWRRPGPSGWSRRSEASLERFRVHVDTWAFQSEVEHGSRGGARASSTRTRPTARAGCGRPRAATTRTGSLDPLADGRARPTSPPTPPTCATSSRAASTA